MHAQSGGDPWSGGSKMGQCKVLIERVSCLPLINVFARSSHMLLDCMGQPHHGHCSKISR
jgi:hypothetical protein